MEINSILITGGNGFLGKEVMLECKRVYPNALIYTPKSKEVDLRERKEVLDYITTLKPDIIISVAARLGGIGDNQAFPASYFYDNITIGMNTIDGARLAGVKKLVNIGTVCSYPKEVPVPFKEEDLWNGYPEPTNGAYGIAKKAVAEYAQAVQKQYGLQSVNLLVTNLYGPGDDFRDATSHVIPALIKKIIAAKENKMEEIVAWGDGSPTRDFLYVRDAAKGIVQALQSNESSPTNLGSGQEVSIKDLFYYLKSEIGFEGKVVWDTTKPNGQPKRLLNIDKAKKEFHFNPETSFEKGIRTTIQWYLENKGSIDQLPAKYV